MSNQNSSRETRYLPQVAVATTAVAVLPVGVVWLLLAEGVISSPWVCVGLAIALSIAASVLGSAYWKRHGGHGDVLFSELLLWGWLYRFRNERRLASAVQLLGLVDAGPGLSEKEESVERKTQILRQMAAALDAQDPYTDGHSRRVALHAAMIARRMGLGREEVAKVRTAAAVHDIGKLRIPQDVLNKPGPLSPAEFEIVKRHPDEGAQIVSCMEDAEITAMVRHHHERFDGDGYPAGLLGVQTPVGARIIAVADTFDALTSARPYRAAVPHKQALETIVAVSGSQLDPVAVRAFLKCYSGKRALVFWTLLAVSPQRALGFAGGKTLARANLGSAATVAMPTALAAVVAAAFGSVGSVARIRSSPRLANQPSEQSVAASAHARTTRRGASRHLLAALIGRPPHARQAVLAISVTRRSSRGSSHPSVGSSGRLGTGGGGAGGQRRASPVGGRGGGSHAGTGVVTFTTPTVGGGPTTPGTKPPTGSGGPKPPPVPNPSGGGPGGGGNPGNGGDNNNGGNGSGDNGGDGHGEHGHKHHGHHGHGGSDSKDACKEGGYISLGFRNQGLCVASFEAGLH